jgi:MoxR-like ATPase
MPKGIAKQNGTCSRCGQPFIAFRDEISWGGGSTGKHYPSCPEVTEQPAVPTETTGYEPVVQEPDITGYDVQATSDQPVCPHGNRVYRSGLAKNGRKWGGWFCPIKAAGCTPQWNRTRKDAPASFPAPTASIPAAPSGNPLMDAILQTIQPHLISESTVQTLISNEISAFAQKAGEMMVESIGRLEGIQKSEFATAKQSLEALVSEAIKANTASTSTILPENIVAQANSIFDSRLRELNPTEVKKLADGVKCSVDLSNIPEYIPQNGEIETLKAIIKAGKNAGIKGGAGCGKTLLVQWVAKQLGAELYEIVGDGGVMREDVIGSRGYNGTETYWIDGTATRALRRSQDRLVILYIDEPNRLRDDIQGALFPVMDERRRLVLPENNGEILQGQPTKNFGAGLVTISSWNEGYRGTNMMDEAYNDRYELGFKLSYLSETRESKLLVDRTGVNPEIASTIVKIAATLRQAVKEKRISTPISTRSLLAWADVVATSGFDVRLAGEMALVEKADAMMDTEAKIIRDTIHTMTKGGVTN